VPQLAFHRISGDGFAAGLMEGTALAAAVRRVYDRAQFEQVWLGDSGGVVYVISEPGVTLPPSPGNW